MTPGAGILSGSVGDGPPYPGQPEGGRTGGRDLGIKGGETTPDLRFTLEEACIGACALAPVMTINDQSTAALPLTGSREILIVTNSPAGGAGGEAFIDLVVKM